MDIICVGQTTWEGDYQKAIVQLCCELAVRHRVLYVDYQHTAKDWLMGALGRQKDVPVRKIARLESPLTTKPGEQGSTVHVWQPPMMLPINALPTAAHDRLHSLNMTRLLAGMRGVMNQLGFRNPIVINGFHPVLGVPMLGQLNEAATIYYCFDEMAAAPWMRQHGLRYEREFLRRVDAVVTTSEALLQKKSELQANAFCVKNGVNFELFHQVRALIDQHPPTRPVVGYLGSADSRVDIDLVEHCVKTMPDVTFQFVGEVREPTITSRLGTYPNVTFTPPHKPEQLPTLLAGWSATMIPFVCNPHTYTIYPLKINEYLAGGLPVVSTPFSILDDFTGIVSMAETPEAFANALRHALTDQSPERIQARIDMARANSWAHRAKEFEAVFEQVLSGKLIMN
ncbi:putative teichuronic acid biosynthesis glycosyltransferase tuaH [Fibrella aestuarina BUZ 2]|uniref:Putative teichuronic acid biosynthesis glycosyltransferase tuaH n=1 Tax=Fibrella aestuarina BUZ 2 TaxID=1166018 RepID=I0K3M0_9BACT|nr:glycosyltransferase [Fibrella aestuarina]CCG98723.1 putative teichuronic acid biosynthesis glycosyltransferase tuaH [Fibrella aestuarina BUZ 2]